MPPNELPISVVFITNFANSVSLLQFGSSRAGALQESHYLLLCQESSAGVYTSEVQTDEPLPVFTQAYAHEKTSVTYVGERLKSLMRKVPML